MTRATLLSLAERAEAADGAETQDIVRQAWLLIHPGHYDDLSGLCTEVETEAAQLVRHQFRNFLRVGAYESAALMLVKQDDVWGVSRQEGGYFQASVMPVVGPWGESKATTPALALVAAACRAIAEERKL